MYDVVVKKFTFAVSSRDELLVNCRVRIVTDDIYVLAVGCGDASL